MNISKISIGCKCGRKASLKVKSPQPDDPPITSKHQCFCGEEFSLSVDNTGKEIFASVEPIPKTPIDLSDPEYS